MWVILFEKYSIDLFVYYGWIKIVGRILYIYIYIIVVWETETNIIII